MQQWPTKRSPIFSFSLGIIAIEFQLTIIVFFLVLNLVFFSLTTIIFFFIKFIFFFVTISNSVVSFFIHFVYEFIKVSFNIGWFARFIFALIKKYSTCLNFIFYNCFIYFSIKVDLLFPPNDDCIIVLDFYLLVKIVHPGSRFHDVLII